MGMMKSIRSYTKEQQEIICRNIYDSGDLDNCKYSNVYNDCINDLNKTIGRYSKYAVIKPKTVTVENDGVIYAASIKQLIYVTYDDKKSDDSISVTLDISSMHANVGYKGKHYSASTGASEDYVEYFKFLPKWFNNFIRELSYVLSWFEINVEDGVYGTPYNFKDFLEFLETYESTYDTSNLDYSKYLFTTPQTVKAHYYRAPAKKTVRKPARASVPKNKVRKMVGNVRGYENSVRRMF